MTRLECSDWNILPDGTVQCLGTLTESAGILPPITLAEANMLLAAIAGVYASVFIVSAIGRTLTQSY